MALMHPIPLDTALTLCHKIREANQSRRWTLGGLRCWRCELISWARPGFADRPDNRGCPQVNARFGDNG